MHYIVHGSGNLIRTAAVNDMVQVPATGLGRARGLFCFKKTSEQRCGLFACHIQPRIYTACQYGEKFACDKGEIYGGRKEISLRQYA